MKPNPSNPAPIKESVAGSGVVLVPQPATPGVPTQPVTLLPAVVPKENVALVTVVLWSTPARPVIENVAVWLRKGLCGPFPAIEPLALVYGPGPIISPEGPVDVPSTVN